MSDQPWQTPQCISHTQLLLKSYRRWLKTDLIPRTETPLEQARLLFESPFVIVSHGTQPDPVLNYGNQTALMLWEMDLPTLTSTPSRYTAEPLHRDERARLLERTTRDGYVDDYSGIRISSTGKRFRIAQAIVWNLVDDAGEYRGQAATFSSWEPLPPTAR
ncbi:MEKHLA domain-containing protein [Planctomicrobium piriforme]|uniref:MEKHLA domain-containing protein n=1 Tax=Planctomicrobium piriforme TaxID=1576369 RepID=A0A1I3K892_9PLAN|nr:MEKHLA domain-containing protein [Planctomicrobium piriforme]SFI68712.1 MEKHLA domain-containing protein [Planctomicrobium piriforme]